MERLPFDPDRVRAPKKRDSDEPLTVSAIADLIRGALERGFPAPVRVVGQLSNLSARHHWYFSLKDDSSVLSCVAWASTVRAFKTRPEEGDEVVVTGTVSHYAPQGRTQFYVTSLEPVGTGSLHVEFQRLCAMLRERGYFDDARKRPLPSFPRRVAVISSGSGAAVHDVMATAQQRLPAVGLVLIDARVQGEGAAADVVRAIAAANAARERLEIDAIILTRGGGSIEDLWTFNEKSVADAVLGSQLPVVAAIGHESDTTIAELVADRRASTPTQAAMVLIPAGDELRQQVDFLQQRQRTVTNELLRQRAMQLRSLVERPWLRQRDGWLAPQRQRVVQMHSALRRAHDLLLMRSGSRLEELSGRLARTGRTGGMVEASARLERMRQRLSTALERRVDRARATVDRAATALAALDPARVLERGFTYTTHDDGRVLRSPDDVQAGDTLTTWVADGSIRSRVVGTDDATNAQLDLFDRAD